MKPWMWWALGALVLAALWKGHLSPAAQASAGVKDPRLMLQSLGTPMSVGRDPKILAELQSPAWGGFGSAGYK